MKRLAVAIACIGLGTGAAWAAADSISGSSTGTWADPLPSTAVISGIGTTTFDWGRLAAGSVRNEMIFTPVSSFIGSPGTPFKVGSLFYQNGGVAAGTQADSVALSLTLNFTTPGLASINGKYVFSLFSTPNVGTPDQRADYVDLPTVMPTFSFVSGGTRYDVKLTGFENVQGDGFLTSNNAQFHVREQMHATADLYAVVSAQPVPEPETYAMLLAGLGAVGIWSRRRRQS